MNNVQLVGRVVNDIKLYDTQNGGVFLPLTIAVDGYYDKKKKEMIPYFIEVKLFGNVAKHCKSLVKGSLISVTGHIKPSQRKKVDKVTGEISTEYTQDIVVNNVSFLSKPKKAVTA